MIYWTEFDWILIISISPKKKISNRVKTELLLKEDMAETDHFYPCLGLAGFLLLVSIPNIFLVYQARKYRLLFAFTNDTVFLKWYFIKGKVPKSRFQKRLFSLPVIRKNNSSKSHFWLMFDESIKNIFWGDCRKRSGSEFSSPRPTSHPSLRLQSWFRRYFEGQGEWGWWTKAWLSAS